MLERHAQQAAGLTQRRLRRLRPLRPADRRHLGPDHAPVGEVELCEGLRRAVAQEFGVIGEERGCEVGVSQAFERAGAEGCHAQRAELEAVSPAQGVDQPLGRTGRLGAVRSKDHAHCVHTSLLLSASDSIQSRKECSRQGQEAPVTRALRPGSGILAPWRGVRRADGPGR